MVSCKWILKYLSSYLDGDLSSSLKKEINEHIAFCHNCKSIYDNARLIREHIKNLPKVKTPDIFEVKLREKIASNKSLKKNIIEEWITLLPNITRKPIIGFAVVAVGFVVFMTINSNSNREDGFKVTKQNIYKENIALPQKGGQPISNLFGKDDNKLQSESKPVLSETPVGINDSTEKKVNVLNTPRSLDANVQYINK